MSEIQIIGEEIIYEGYVVARLTDDVPPSIMSDFKVKFDKTEREEWNLDNRLTLE